MLDLSRHVGQVFFAHLIYMCKSEESLLRSTALLLRRRVPAWAKQKQFLLTDAKYTLYHG